MSLVTGAGRAARRRQEIGPQFSLLVVILVLCTLFTLKQPGYISSFNLYAIGRSLAVDAVIGFSQMVVLATGGMNLSVGSIADVTVLKLEQGTFGYTDMYGARLKGNKRLVAELTLRDGKVVYDLDGITRPDWTTLPKGYLQSGDARWDAITPAAGSRENH